MCGEKAEREPRCQVERVGDNPRRGAAEEEGGEGRLRAHEQGREEGRARAEARGAGAKARGVQAEEGKGGGTKGRGGKRHNAGKGGHGRRRGGRWGGGGGSTRGGREAKSRTERRQEGRGGTARDDERLCPQGSETGRREQGVREPRVARSTPHRADAHRLPPV